MQLMNDKVPVFPRLDAIAKQFASQIKEARIRRGMSQDEMRQKIGVSRGNIISIENGSTSVSLGKYLQVLSVLELEEDILLVAKEDALGREINSRNLSGFKRLARKA